MDDVIVLDQLTKTYGRRRGLAGLTLRVHAGEVLGFLGPNGAGKSTTIRLLLDLIRPTSGTLRVLGLDPRADAVALHRRVGYLAGDFIVDGRQTVASCLRFLAALRGGIPARRITALTERLDLDTTARITGLSKGNRQKLGIVQAFMHRPELLILDEPTSGLDPLVQQTFLDLVTEARADGRTVFMSSHIMAEVEAVADRVAIIRDGALAALDTVAGLRHQAVRDIELTFTTPVTAADFAGLPGVTDLRVTATTLRCRLTGSPDALLRAATRHTVTSLTATEPALEDLFHAYYTGADSAA
ncbi:ABC transporter [Actinoplanes philippinensis]|uniref:ABC-2 type transport system ATP-binding protein n=1 Tax=Actinoplanes philippinensis TaxID=35752 RepID=A0A1I2IC34_9ACTN|nr:ABC transporter ATP-binding protein [Actinoplanes philippinensis]GIE78436.1 ABC transporter [Actinoplanes philippinensis]SFF39213.1 ABC-2 type transport system ATP-binding protein [Actinoplanes philippinensis]